MSIETDARLLAGAIRPFEQRLPRHIGLAVSGGSDSMAMLWLVAPWAQANGIPVSVATVDHGLRPEARSEAAFVAQVCAGIGVSHTVLEWTGWNGQGNLQAMARDARARLLGEWARASGIDTLALGHTMDDQAETVLMRLARGSGVDGLSGMAEMRVHDGLRWIRPLLSERRAALRDYLQRYGRVWVDDPSNQDDAYDRVRVRKALVILKPLGVDAEGLNATAGRLRMASTALAHYARIAADSVATVQGGDVVFDRHAFAALPDETRLRLAAAAIRWVSGTTYRPRLSALQDALAATGRRSLQGTLLSTNKDRFRISREWQAVRDTVTPTGQIWDGRWRMARSDDAGLHDPALVIRALGEAGLRQCPGWRATGLPRQSLLASPSVWRDDTLIAAPLADKPDGWTARIVADFHASLVSH